MTTHSGGNLRLDRVWHGYVLSPVLVLLVAALLHALGRFIPLSAFPYPYILLLTAVAIYWGPGPAVTGAAIGWLAFTYSTPAVSSRAIPESWMPQAAFLSGVLLGIGLGMLVRRNSERLAERTLQLEDEIRQRRAIEQDLRESETSLIEAQRLAKMGSWELDLETGAVRWTQQIFHVLGQDPSLPPPSIEQHKAILAPTSWKLMDGALTEASTNGTPYSVELEAKDGNWIMAEGEAVRDPSGKIVMVRGMAQDITKRKRAELALRESEERFRVLADSTPVMIWVRDTAGRLLFVNRAYCEFFGLTLDEALDSDRPIALHPDDQWAMEEWKRALAEHRSLHTVVRLQRHDGQWRWIENFGAPRLSPTGEFLGIGGSSPDVTERILAEEALLQSREMLARAEQISNTGSWEWNIGTGELIWSSQCYRVFGRDPATFVPTFDSFMESVAPEFHEPQTQAVELALSGKKPYDIEFRVLLPDGSSRWVHAMSEVTVDGSGKPTRMNGAVADITERKLAQDALAEASAAAERRAEELRVLMEAVPVGVFVAEDPDCRRISANEEGQALLSVPRAANVSKSAPEGEKPTTWQEMVGGVPLSTDELPVQRAVRGEQVRGFEMDLVFSNGVVKTVLGNASPLLDQSGKPRGAIAVLMDITQRRDAEKALLESEAHKLEFYRKTLAAATGGKLQIAAADEISGLVGASICERRVASPQDYKEVRGAIAEKATELGMDEGTFWRLDTCVGEMLANALKHAGGGRASVHSNDGRFYFVVSDQGRGIDPINLPEVALVDGYTTAGTGGLGYRLITESADRTYLSTDRSGTTVAVELALQGQEKPTPAAMMREDRLGG